MGYCEGGDLYTKLKEYGKNNEYLSERQIVEWFVQIAMALQVQLLKIKFLLNVYHQTFIIKFLSSNFYH